jgi:hypothetical protein
MQTVLPSAQDACSVGTTERSSSASFHSIVTYVTPSFDENRFALYDRLLIMVSIMIFFEAGLGAVLLLSPQPCLFLFFVVAA